MRRLAFLLPFCLFCVFCSCGGRIVNYAEEYTFDCPTRQLLDAIDSLKSVYPHYNFMVKRNGVDSLVNPDDDEDPNGIYAYRNFKLVKDGDTIFFATAIHIAHMNDTFSKYDIMNDPWTARLYYGSLYFIVVYIGEPFSRGKSINTEDLTHEENRYYKQVFEDSIVSKIRKFVVASQNKE